MKLTILIAISSLLCGLLWLSLGWIPVAIANACVSIPLFIVAGRELHRLRKLAARDKEIRRNIYLGFYPSPFRLVRFPNGFDNNNHPKADPVPPEHNGKSRLANAASGKCPTCGGRGMVRECLEAFGIPCPECCDGPPDETHIFSTIRPQCSSGTNQRRRNSVAVREESESAGPSYATEPAPDGSAKAASGTHMRRVVMGEREG